MAIDGTLLVGSLPRRALRLVREWAALHETELQANWERVLAREPLVPIDPLRNIDRMADVTPLPRIIDVEVLGDHALRLTFDDGVVGDVTFGDDEWWGVLEPLRDQELFARVGIEMGTLCWPGELDMAPEPLYAAANRNPAPVSSTSG